MKIVYLALLLLAHMHFKFASSYDNFATHHLLASLDTGQLIQSFECGSYKAYETTVPEGQT